MANIPPATRPVRSAARASSISHPAPPTSSPLSPGRATRPAVPTPRKAIPTPGRASPRNPDRPPSSSGSPERPSSRSSYNAALARETEEKESVSFLIDLNALGDILSDYVVAGPAPPQSPTIRGHHCGVKSATIHANDCHGRC